MSFFLSSVLYASLSVPLDVSVCSNMELVERLPAVYKQELYNVCHSSDGYKSGAFYVDLGNHLMPLPNRFVIKVQPNSGYMFESLEYVKLGVSENFPRGGINVKSPAVDIADFSPQDVISYESYGIDYYRSACGVDLEVKQVTVQVTGDFVPTFQIFEINEKQIIYRDSNPYLLDAIFISMANINCKPSRDNGG